MAMVNLREFKNYERKGKGIYFYANGKISEGEFNDDK